MRIAFDGTTLCPGRTGVGYYTEHLLQHLAREAQASGDEIVVVSNQAIDTERPAIDRSDPAQGISARMPIDLPPVRPRQA